MRSEDESVFPEDEVVLFPLHLDQILLVHAIHQAALRHIVHGRIIDILWSILEQFLVRSLRYDDEFFLRIHVLDFIFVDGSPDLYFDLAAFDFPLFV